MEVVLEEDVFLVLFFCIVIFCFIVDFGGLIVGNVYICWWVCEKRLGFKDWGFVVLENGSK